MPLRSRKKKKSRRQRKYRSHSQDIIDYSKARLDSKPNMPRPVSRPESPAVSPAGSPAGSVHVFKYLFF